MSYSADFSQSQQDATLRQIQMALASICLDIQAEATSTANHAARSTYSMLALANLSGYTQLMAPTICTDGAVTGASTDAQVKTRISSVFNAFCVQS